MPRLPPTGPGRQGPAHQLSGLEPSGWGSAGLKGAHIELNPNLAGQPQGMDRRRPRADPRQQALRVVEATAKLRNAEPFRQPVPGGTPLYASLIARPRDLGTICAALEAGRASDWQEGPFSSAAEVFQDVQLVWDNCLAYNVGPDGQEIRQAAADVRAAFQHKWRAAKLPEELPQPPAEQRLAEDALPASLCVRRSEPRASTACAGSTLLAGVRPCLPG